MAKYFYEQGDYDRAISLYEDLYSYRVVEQKNLDASTFLHMNSLITILLNESNYDRIKEIICTTAEDTPEMKSILAQLVIHTRADRWLVEYHKSVSSTYDSNHPAVFYSLTNLEDTFMKQADYRFIYHLEQFKIMAYVKTNEDNNESISNMLLECLNSICGTGESYKVNTKLYNKLIPYFVHQKLIYLFFVDYSRLERSISSEQSDKQ